MVRLPAVHAAGVAAAPWAVRRRGSGRQVDGEALEIKTGTYGAAPFGGTQDLERKQDEAPGMWFETDSVGEGIPLLRPHVIESAGEPR